MTDRNRELLSALMDGETSEHETHQALRAGADDPRLADTWRRWHLAQSALRGEPGLTGIDLRARINAQLDREPALPAPRRDLWRPLLSVAVAASVAVLTVVAWRSVGTQPADAEQVMTVAQADGQRVMLGPMVLVREDGEELVMPADTDQPGADSRLDGYMARHAQAAGWMPAPGLSPYARLVSAESEAGR
jgi:sigma-E factor negative regulatory protein RseA